jgi:ribonuclease-3
MDLEQLQNEIGVKFKNVNNLSQALIHRSYLNENKNKHLESNERLEFLGDSILELWISDTLYRMFPQFDEGNLTNLRSLIVRTENLALADAKFNLGQFVALSKGEEMHGGRTNISILADTFEALVGAIYIDQGQNASFQFLDNMLHQSIIELSSKKIYKDPKSLFQEIAQAKKGITPHYETISESGPDHLKVFKVAVFLNEELIATGTGNSKQKAEEDASIKATKIINNPV